MKRLVEVMAAVLFLVLGLGGSLAHAHRVGVFCWVEGNMLHTQSKFQPGGPVKGGRLQMVIPATGEVLASGRTDLKGEYTFEIPATLREKKLDFRVILVAGSGHKGYWDVPAAEYLDGAEVETKSPVPALKTTSSAPSLSGKLIHDPHMSGISLEDLQELLDRELDRKLAPVKGSLARMQEDRPSVREIIGGIGYIFGIMGIVLYFKSKKSV